LLKSKPKLYKSALNIQTSGLVIKHLSPEALAKAGVKRMAKK
jgi:hypothetical protein